MTRKETGGGYHKYINYKMFAIAVTAFVLLLAMPTPPGMRDVGVEYAAGEHRVLEFISHRLFNAPYAEVSQWNGSRVSPK